MKPTLDTRVQDALVTALNLEKTTSGAASRLAYSLRQQLDDIVDEVDRMTYEYAVELMNEQSGKWRICRFYGLFTHGQEWFGSREEAEQQIERSYPADLVEPRPYRIIGRLVSETEIMG